MSLSTARSFLSEVYYDEQELDANSALMELDKGMLGVHGCIRTLSAVYWIIPQVSNIRHLWVQSSP
uniref:Uncharacterized protein n=1 Tax=Sphaeramia orbicularis TaxID=375764 RepID=A0A673BE75_9TELE